MANQYAAGRSRAVPFNTLSLVRSLFRVPCLSLALLGLRLTRPDKVARQVAQLYFARWFLLLPSDMARLTQVGGAKSGGAYLLFISDFTGDLDEYLSAFARLLTGAMNLIWGSCVAWPEASHSSAFMTYVRNHQLTGQTYFNAYRESTVGDIRSALRVCELVEGFVLKNSDLIGAPEGPNVDEDFQSAFHQLLMQMDANLAS